ncbi:ATP-binding protein [Streptomyces sp. NBC_00582]|uniref:ATP-binding protein n=1 Tax=Streptomyces sp. NBC_00582 TaxID=2975783 RepID=UPI002E801333|nr:ATP-binding protein [Streptomyces sp. NBC_00582]
MNQLHLRTRRSRHAARPLAAAGALGCEAYFESREGWAVLMAYDADGRSSSGPAHASASSPHLQTTLAADPAAIGAARRGLRERLLEWGLEPIADDVALAAQELLTNAVKHGCRGVPSGTCEVTLTAWCSATRLRVAVTDPSTEVPRRRFASSDCEDGRGLRLVDEVADRWGATTEPDGSGKTVWLELAAPRGRRAPLS